MSTGGPLPSVPHVLKMTLLWTVGADQLVYNILHWHYTGATPQPADLNTLAQAAGQSAVTQFGPLTANTTTLTSLTYQDLSSAMGAVGVYQIGHTGTATGQAVPAGACVVVSWQIGRHYRGGHPRTYFPFGTATSLATPQTWNITSSVGTAVTSWRGVVIGSISGTTSIDYQCSIPYVSKQINPTPPHRNPNPTPDPILGFHVNTYVGSQRRRQLATH